MDTAQFDVIVIGAGIAGSSAAAFLSFDHRVALIEAEEVAGYHTTGRSAAIWILNYGPPDVVALTGRSRTFFEAPPPGFADAPLFSPRGVLSLAPAEQSAHLDAKIANGIGLEEISIAEACALVPAIRPDYATRAAIERDAFDMDVAALHQGFLKQLRINGGVLALRSRSGLIEKRGVNWHVEVTGGAEFNAPTIVNAAGAWGDQVAMQAGLLPVGLVPKRRTAAVIDPAPFTPLHWPMVGDVDHTWYARCEARSKLMVSPADETPMDPQDVQPDEFDIAVGIDRMQQALDIEVRRVEHSWAGLRSFSPDGSLVIGADPLESRFFWCIGQGGYGIQTAPAAGQLMADLVSGRDPGEPGKVLASIDPRRFR